MVVALNDCDDRVQAKAAVACFYDFGGGVMLWRKGGAFVQQVRCAGVFCPVTGVVFWREDGDCKALVESGEAVREFR